MHTPYSSCFGAGANVRRDLQVPTYTPVHWILDFGRGIVV